MNWWLWMGAGAAAAALALFLYICIANWHDDRAVARQRRIRQQQSSAEQDMQRIVQDTIGKMFEATRGHYR